MCDGRAALFAGILVLFKQQIKCVNCSIKKLTRYNSTPGPSKKKCKSHFTRKSNELALFNLPTAIAHLHWPEPFFTCVDAAGGQWTDDMTAQNV
jgi:hypothetical protein